MPQSQYGKTRVFEDFLNFEDNIAATGVATGIVFGTGFVSVGDVGLVSVNEGSLAWTIDEPNGVLAITTDTGDNDNAALISGRYQPSLGGCAMEVRFKVDSVAATHTSIFAGFSETLNFTTPVMPAEYSGTSMTYNGAGGMVGLVYDVDGTTDNFYSVFGDAGAISGGATVGGVSASETITADEWYIVRVEIDPDGTGRVYIGHDGGLGGGMDLIEEVSTAAVTSTDQQYAVLMIENRSGNARVLEVDYFAAEGGRDWTV